ncbi:MAG: hypothetical protein H7257_07090 [Taibaiella sp.]|nr:hypothetical protein [Taibaiella sp.]
MNKIKNIVLAFGCFWVLPLMAEGQQLSEKFIVRDLGDSLYIKAFRSAFDTTGNYYFETMLPGKAAKFAMMTNRKKIAPVFTGGSIAIMPYKAMIADAFFSDSTRRKIYYKNKTGTTIYGPRGGKIREVLDYGHDHIAIELSTGGKSSLYINDSLVNVTDTLKQAWLCSISENGNMLYSVYKNGSYQLFLNHKLIDSAATQFAGININDNGFYIYAKPDNGKYYAHTPSKKFGPLAAVDLADLKGNNAYYFRGCAESQCYVLVNDKMFSGIAEAQIIEEDAATGTAVSRSDELISVEAFSPTDFVFTYNQSKTDGIFLNLNGKVIHTPYSYIGFVAYDKQLGYAYYGIRYDSTIQGDRLYTNVNGKERVMPPLKRKVPSHTQCVSIYPDSASVYYYETKDTVFLYSNGAPLYKPVSAKKFGTWDASSLPLTHTEGLEYFAGLNVEDNSYIVYNNTVSKPLTLINPDYGRLDEPKKGNIVAGDISPLGYYIIIVTGPGKYLLVINNKVYKELEGIDQIFGESACFTPGAVIFYGRKGSSFYEYRVAY